MEKSHANLLLKELSDEDFESIPGNVTFASVKKKDSDFDEYYIEIGIKNKKNYLIEDFYDPNKITVLKETPISDNLINKLQNIRNQSVKLEKIEDLKSVNFNTSEIDSLNFNYEILNFLKIQSLISIGFSNDISNKIVDGGIKIVDTSDIELSNCGNENNAQTISNSYIQGGISISAQTNLGHRIGPGTLGGIFKQRRNDSLYGITNAHVLAFSSEDPPMNKVIHPGCKDSSINRVTFGSILLRKITCYEDIGVVHILDSIPKKSNTRCSEVKIKGIDLPRENNGYQYVKKCGRTTGFTKGTITSLNSTVYTTYLGRRLKLINQIETTCMNLGGDSGSLLINKDNNAVGLIFAKRIDNKATFANPLKEAFSRHNIDFEKFY